MSDGYTFATCVIPDSEKAAAQETYPAYFVVGLSADGSAPATHWVTSGALDNSEITEMVTHFPAGWKFDFGNDLSGALANWGLQAVVVEQPVANQGLVTEDLQTVTPPISQQT